MTTYTDFHLTADLDVGDWENSDGGTTSLYSYLYSTSNYIYCYNWSNIDPYKGRLPTTIDRDNMWHVYGTRLYFSRSCTTSSNPYFWISYSYNNIYNAWQTDTLFTTSTSWQQGYFDLNNITVSNCRYLALRFQTDSGVPSCKTCVRTAYFRIYYYTLSEAAPTLTSTCGDPDTDGSFRVSWGAKDHVDYYDINEYLNGVYQDGTNTTDLYWDRNVGYGCWKYDGRTYGVQGRFSNYDTITCWVCPPPTSVAYSDSVADRDIGTLKVSWVNSEGNNPTRWETKLSTNGVYGSVSNLGGTLRTKSYTGLTNKIPYKIAVRSVVVYDGTTKYSSWVELSNRYVSNGWQGTICGRVNPSYVAEKQDSAIDDWVCGKLDDDDV